MWYNRKRKGDVSGDGMGYGDEMRAVGNAEDADGGGEDRWGMIGMENCIRETKGK